jgi:fatty acid desaturase
MPLFVHKADRAPVATFVAMFAVDVAVYLLVDSPWLLALYFLLGILPKAAVCAYNHHHQHVSTFSAVWANRLLELMYGFQTGITSNAWVLHHSLGHHLNYLDQTKDESRWRRDDGSVMREFEYAFVGAVSAYPRAWKVGAKHPALRRTFVAMLALTLVLMAALVAYRPLPGLFVFVCAPLFSLWGTVWATYVHHSNLSTASHSEASTNVTQRFYNWVTGNLGFHTAHHTKPGVHWSKLPELHQQLEADIPDHCYVAPGWPWRLLGDGLPPAVKARRQPAVGDISAAAS